MSTSRASAPTAAPAGASPALLAAVASMEPGAVQRSSTPARSNAPVVAGAPAARLAPAAVRDTAHAHSGAHAGPEATAGAAAAAGAGQLMPAGQPGTVSAGGAITASAWNGAWEAKFRGVLEQMGLPATEVRSQLAAAASQPATEAQLTQALREMQTALGGFDTAWRTKFTALLEELEVPADERTQVLAGLASGGLTSAQLQQAYTEMASQKPAWNPQWESKFAALEIPAQMLEGLRESGAPAAALQGQFDQMLQAKLAAKRDGRLERLTKAKATPDEKWKVILEGPKGKELDAEIERIRKGHVDGWKRFASLGVNLIPGVYAAQYLTGKDWITGDKIDRTNPLNMIGAVASGFAGFSAVRGAVQGVQGLRAANAAYSASKAIVAGGGSSTFSAGARSAIEGANLLTKFERGLKVTDYLKAATPIVNRFGEAGRLASVGRGYHQGMQLAAGAAAMRTTAGGAVTVDKATRASVLGKLRQGGSIDEALAGVQRSAGGATPSLSNAQVSNVFTRNGFTQAGGNWKFNPFRRDATVVPGAVGANGTRVVELGRGMNFATRGGLAQGVGTLQAANVARLPEALRANALAASGITSAQVANAGLDGAYVARWGDKLGVAGSGVRGTLSNLGTSAAEVRRTARLAEHGGSQAYRAASRLAQVPSNSRIIVPSMFAGTAIGATGAQAQPYWEYLKNKPELDRAARAAERAAEREQAELERLWQEQGGAAATGTPGATAGAAAGEAAGTTPAAGSDAATTDPTAGSTPLPAQPEVLGASPSGGQYVYDPAVGGVYDTATGDVMDAQTGAVIGSLNGPQAQPRPADGPPATGADTGGASGPAPLDPVADEGAATYLDPSTGRLVDEATGMSVDPDTGDVHDQTGAFVGNLAQMEAAQ